MPTLLIILYILFFPILLPIFLIIDFIQRILGVEQRTSISSFIPKFPDKIYKSYEEYLKSNKWMEKRSQALRRDGFNCRRGGARASQVHHTKYPKREELGNEPLEWLVSLCGPCHEIVHDPELNTAEQFRPIGMNSRIISRELRQELNRRFEERQGANAEPRRPKTPDDDLPF